MGYPLVIALSMGLAVALLACNIVKGSPSGIALFRGGGGGACL